MRNLAIIVILALAGFVAAAGPASRPVSVNLPILDPSMGCYWDMSQYATTKEAYAATRAYRAHFEAATRWSMDPNNVKR